MVVHWKNMISNSRNNITICAILLTLIIFLITSQEVPWTCYYSLLNRHWLGDAKPSKNVCNKDIKFLVAFLFPFTYLIFIISQYRFWGISGFGITYLSLTLSIIYHETNNVTQNYAKVFFLILRLCNYLFALHVITSKQLCHPLSTLFIDWDCDPRLPIQLNQNLLISKNLCFAR